MYTRSVYIGIIFINVNTDYLCTVLILLLPFNRLIFPLPPDSSVWGEHVRTPMPSTGKSLSNLTVHTWRLEKNTINPTVKATQIALRTAMTILTALKWSPPDCAPHRVRSTVKASCFRWTSIVVLMRPDLQCV